MGRTWLIVVTLLGGLALSAPSSTAQTAKQDVGNQQLKQINVSIVLAGLDSKTGQFTEPPDQIKKDMDEIKQEKQMSEQDKDQALSEMQEALQTAAPLQFKENVALVKKYQNELDQVLQQEPTKQ